MHLKLWGPVKMPHKHKHTLSDCVSVLYPPFPNFSYHSLSLLAWIWPFVTLCRSLRTHYSTSAAAPSPLPTLYLHSFTSVAPPPSSAFILSWWTTHVPRFTRRSDLCRHSRQINVGARQVSAATDCIWNTCTAWANKKRRLANIDRIGRQTLILSDHWELWKLQMVYEGCKQYNHIPPDPVESYCVLSSCDSFFDFCFTMHTALEWPRKSQTLQWSFGILSLVHDVFFLTCYLLLSHRVTWDPNMCVTGPAPSLVDISCPEPPPKKTNIRIHLWLDESFW